jgi:cell shape-determining protein MreD
MWAAILVAAILHDGLDLGAFGPSLLSFPAVGLAAYRIRNEIFADGLVSQLVLGALLGLFTTVVALLVYSATGQREVHPLMVMVRLISATGLGMITLPLVSRTISRIEASLPKQKGYGWQ